MKEEDLYIGMRVVPHAKTISWDNNARDFLRKEGERWNKKEGYLSISEINFLDKLVLGTNVTLINEDFPEWGGNYYSIDDIEPYEDVVYDSKWDTKKHIYRVQELIKIVLDILQKKADDHDWSKLSETEKPYFDEYTPKLKGCIYGSEEYKQYLKELKPALDHHYENNAHHPEHYTN